MDWVIPDAIGVENNKLDDLDGHITTEQRRKYLIDIVSAVSENTGLKWSQILKSILGSNEKKNLTLKKKLEYLKAIQSRRGSPSTSLYKKRTKSINSSILSSSRKG